MKRSFGAMASSWLRKPANQQKLKSAGRKLWDRFQGRKGADTARSDDASPAKRHDGGAPGADTPRSAGQDGNPKRNRP